MQEFGLVSLFMKQAFGPFLQLALDRKMMSQREFAKRAHSSSASLSQIISGKRTPPLDQIDNWANILDLKGEDRVSFLELACLEHCPEPLRQEYLRMKGQILRLEQRLTKLEEQR
jgi:transcriptional regulator with XRE-family HTH domain